MKNRNRIYLTTLGIILWMAPLPGQSFSYKDDLLAERMRSTSDYRKTVRFTDLFEYPAGYDTKARIEDSSDVTIAFASSDDSRLLFDGYYYSSYSGQYFYYKVPAGAYGIDTLTVTITYNSVEAVSRVIVNVDPIACSDDSYDMDVGDTLEVTVTSNDKPSSYLDASTFEIISDVSHGASENMGDGTIRYINGEATPNYTIDQLVYRIADDENNYDTATVSFSIHHNSYVSKVFGFLPAPGQYVNTSWADTAAAEKLIGNTSGGVSLGGFGGYIIAGFDQPIVNREENPYGVDFTVVGNAFSGWGEPAAVRVMKDENGNGLPDDTWVELAGSEYYFQSAVKDLTMTYINPKYNGRFTIPYRTDKGFNGAMRTNSYHSQSYYPEPYSFGISMDSVAYNGTFTRFLLDKSQSGSIVAKRLPAFGYADSRPANSTPTEPRNPYFNDENGNAADGFDLEWAVDENGDPVELDTVHFVKVYSTVQEDAGWLGEISPEIFKVAITTPQPGYVPVEYEFHAIGAAQLQVLKGTAVQYEGILFRNGLLQTGTPVWTSDSTHVATIDNTGLLTALDNGQTTIRFSAKAGVAEDSLIIEVVELTGVLIELEGNTGSADTLNMVKGEIQYIHAEATDNRPDPANRFVYEQFNWSSSDKSVGTIDQGIFLAISPGITTVIAKSVHSPELADTLVVIVDEIPEITAVSDTVSIPYYGRTGVFENDELFQTGNDAIVFMKSIVYTQTVLDAEIRDNRFEFSCKEGEYGYETVRFTVEAYGSERAVNLVFHAVEPDNLETPKQVVFVNGGEFMNPNAPTQLMSYFPENDTTLLIDESLAGATSVQDMIIDGNYAYVSADYHITRYNLSKGLATDSVYTQDLSPDAADGLGTETAGVNHKLAVYNNLLLATRQNSSSAPEDGYNVRIYNKGDLSFIRKIPVSDQATDIVVANDSAYVMINGGFMGTSSALAVIDLNTLTLDREIDLGTYGLGVMQMQVKDDKIYGIRLADFAGTYGSGIVIYDIATGSVEELEYSAGIPYDSSPLSIEPMTGDTLFVKKDLGYIVFNTQTKTYGTDIHFPIPSDYTRDLDHIGRGSVYDTGEGRYYIAYAYWQGSGVGRIYDSKLDSTGRFDGVGASPEVMKVCLASEMNEKPYPGTSNSPRTYDEGEDFSFSLSSYTFRDYEDTRPSMYLYNPARYDWLSYDPGTRRITGNYNGEATDTTTFDVIMQGIDQSGAYALDTVEITILPVDDPMVPGEPIADITVGEDAPDSLIDLTRAFIDVDNVINTSVSANSNETLITTSIAGNVLTIVFNEEQSGQAEVIVEAESNGLVLTDTFLVVVNAFDDPPHVAYPIFSISGYTGTSASAVDLGSVFDDVDGDGPFSYEVTVNSDSSVAIASIDDQTLLVDFLAEGQANIAVNATSNGKSTADTFVVGIYPLIEGNYVISDFEDLSLENGSYWNGSDESGGFGSGQAYFPNDYNAAWASWSGWSYSNMGDRTTAGWLNQYSAITAAGFDTLASGGNNYGLSFVSPVSQIRFASGAARETKGFYVTNSTYAALSMEQGDAFGKKFGGATGDDPDWFKLSVWGFVKGTETDTIEFYLADFRFEDNSRDYIVKTWQWVELGTLGKVDSMMFALSSSDNGDWGMNTPAYLCLDNLYLVPDAAPFVANPLADIAVFENSPDSVIGLSDVFSDPDDEDGAISKALASNSNPALVIATVAGDALSLSFASGTTGTAEIVIEGQSNGLAVTDTFKVTVSPASGMPDNHSAAIVVYPNPTDGKFRLAAESGGQLRVRVYGPDGRLVYDNPDYSSEQEIDISHRAAGTYILKAGRGKTVHTFILIKQ